MYADVLIRLLRGFYVVWGCLFAVMCGFSFPMIVVQYFLIWQ